MQANTEEGGKGTFRNTEANTSETQPELVVDDAEVSQQPLEAPQSPNIAPELQQASDFHSNSNATMPKAPKLEPIQMQVPENSHWQLLTESKMFQIRARRTSERLQTQPLVPLQQCQASQCQEQQQQSEQSTNNTDLVNTQHTHANVFSSTETIEEPISDYDFDEDELSDDELELINEEESIDQYLSSSISSVSGNSYLTITDYSSQADLGSDSDLEFDQTIYNENSDTSYSIFSAISEMTSPQLFCDSPIDIVVLEKQIDFAVTFITISPSFYLELIKQQFLFINMKLLSFQLSYIQ